jgi:hypothetical protein
MQKFAGINQTDVFICLFWYFVFKELSEAQMTNQDLTSLYLLSLKFWLHFLTPKLQAKLRQRSPVLLVEHFSFWHVLVHLLIIAEEWLNSHHGSRQAQRELYLESHPSLLLHQQTGDLQVSRHFLKRYLFCLEVSYLPWPHPLFQGSN